MHAIELDFTIKYLDCELADERVESKPVIRTYYDTHFERTESGDGILMTELDEHDLSKVYGGTLKAKVERNKARIPMTACIGLASYAQRRNEFGMVCYTDAGSTHVKLADIFEGLKRNKQFKTELPLLMETTRIQADAPIEKGRIEFTVTRARVGKGIQFLSSENCIVCTSPESQKQVADILDSRVAFESSMQDTWEGVQNVRAQMDISNVGVELTKTYFTPIEGFAIVNPLEINVDYFQNAFECSLRRRNLDPERDYKHLDVAHKAEVMAELCTFAAQSFDYISDSVDTNNRQSGNRYDPHLKWSSEIFSDSGVMFSGDCEDGGKQIQVVHHHLANVLKIDPATHPHLSELQEYSRKYVLGLTLATVHGAKADDNTEKIGAHMYALFIPKQQFKACLNNNPLGRELLPRLPLADDTNLPTLFGEGTGRIRPLGTGPTPTWSTVRNTARAAMRAGEIGASANHPMSYDPLFNERRYVSMNMRSNGGLKMEIPHDIGAPSSFYLGNLMIVTNEFMQYGINVGAFICGKVDWEKKTITRGASFVDLINQHDTVAFIPMQPLSDAVVEITRESAALRTPPQSFILDHTKPMMGEKPNPLLERLKTNVAAMGRTGMAPFGSVDIFMRPHQFNEGSIAHIEQDISQMERIFKVDYELEHITNAACVYRVRLFVDNKNV